MTVKRLIIENNKEYVTISRDTCPLFPHAAEVMAILSVAFVTCHVTGDSL